MPIYEFVCNDCETDFEELVTGRSEAVCCPDCGGAQVKKKMSTFAFKSGGKFSGTHKGSCDSCSPGPGGCSSCGCH